MRGDEMKKLMLIAFAALACSCFAALAGVFLAGRIVSGDPNVGLLFELDAITAVAIGGTQNFVHHWQQTLCMAFSRQLKNMRSFPLKYPSHIQSYQLYLRIFCS